MKPILAKFFLSLCLLSFTLSFCRNGTHKEMELTVVRVMDERLPGLSQKDMQEILNEGERVIRQKLGPQAKFRIRDLGSKNPEEFFREVNFKNTEFDTSLRKWKFPLNENSPKLDEKETISTIKEFLKGWKLENIQKYFPNQKIKNYTDAAILTHQAHAKKIQWLKTLQTNSGNTILKKDAPPFQSYTEWLSLMYSQDQYDIIFTNTLIVLDTANTPYLHSITKHAKVGGSSFVSPKREVMGGRSLLVNVLEVMGDIPEFGNYNKVSQDKKNRMLGGFLFAHEFGHAFYLMPDVYDHGNDCLMNSSFDGMEMESGYDMLVKANTICLKCNPWIESKNYSLMGLSQEKASQWKEAGESYSKAAKTLPQLIDGDRKETFTSYMIKAETNFRKANRNDLADEIKKERPIQK